MLTWLLGSLLQEPRLPVPPSPPSLPCLRKGTCLPRDLKTHLHPSAH